MTDYVRCAPGDLLRGGDRFRATWAATGTGSTLVSWLTGRGVKDNLDYLFAAGIVATGLGFPVSPPAVAPGDDAGTLDLQIALAVPAGVTVGRLATALEEQATLGRNLSLTRLERYAAAAGSQADATARTGATATGNATAAESGLSGAVVAVKKGVSSLLHTAVVVAIVAGGVYLFVTSKGSRRMDW